MPLEITHFEDSDYWSQHQTSTVKQEPASEEGGWNGTFAAATNNTPFTSNDTAPEGLNVHNNNNNGNGPESDEDALMWDTTNNETTDDPSANGQENPFHDFDFASATTTTAETSTAPQMDPNSSKSGIDGIGLFKSWRDSYDTPTSACLDLLDNCFDATLPQKNHAAHWRGKVAMHYIPSAGFVILNNSFKAIKPLASVLTAYRSEKSSHDNIGEYGVGLKQAVATLSNCNFILTRSGYDFELGVISSRLQTKHSVNLPHFSFSIHPDATVSDKSLTAAVKDRLFNVLRTNSDILKLATSEFAPNSDPMIALDRLVQRCKQMLDEEWKPYDRVFQVVICNLIHTSYESARITSGIPLHPAKRFLYEIRDMLPKHYINIPRKGFDFFVEEERVQFTYWQNRLVEMTKFEVNIPKETPIQNMDDNSNWQRQGYDLSVYCGFDALRVEDSKNQAQTCQLCIYSRQSGRLIEVENDARNILGMSSSGVDFSQGLTVIVDDAGGNLPLKPTKDGLTWSKEPRGEVHKSNLLAWVGGVGYQYWKHHCANFEKMGSNYKTLFKQAVLSFAEPVKERLKEEAQTMAQYLYSATDDATPISERLEDAKFDMFSEVTWKKTVSSNSKKLTIRKKMIRLDICNGPATIFRFDICHQQPAPAKKPPARKLKKKRKSMDPQMVERLRQKQKQQKEAVESSSGSEEEDLGDLELSTATHRPAAGGVGLQSNANPPMGTNIECSNGLSAATAERTAQLEKELTESREREQRLESDLTKARVGLLYRPTSRSSMEGPETQALRQENDLLRKEKAQLERDLQALREDTHFEIQELKLNVRQLEVRVRQRETMIQRLQGGGGNHP